MQLPAFTKGKSQLHPLEIEDTRTIANVRIHIERVIGLLRTKYRILNQRKFPLLSIARKGGGDCKSVIDEVVILSPLLLINNLCHSICISD